MSIRSIFKRKIRVTVILLAVMILTGGAVSAQSNSGQTAASFLKIGFGARAAGMADAFSSMATGAEAAFWNPAGLTLSDQNEVVFSHFSWYQEISIEQGAASFKLNEDISIGAMFTFVNYGQVNGFDNNGDYTHQLDLSDWAGGIALGYTINDQFSAGVTGKYISQKVEGISGAAFAFDFGLKYSQSRFGLAAFVGNIGSDIKFDSQSEKLPSLFRVGANMYHFKEMLNTSLDIEKQFDGNLIIKQGAEFSYEGKYFLRTGFNYFPDQENRKTGSSLAFGGGVNMYNLKVDYSFTPTDSYTNEALHRFSFSFFFGN